MKTNNYPNWLVPLEIAKELKEIGFDLPCTFFWDTSEYSNLRCLSDNSLGEISANSIPSNLDYNKPNIGGYYACASAPTWEQVLNWFRYKGFYSYIKKKSSPERYIYYIEYGLITYSEESKEDNFLPKTYEEAREKLVNKLIEGYKKLNKILINV